MKKRIIWIDLLRIIGMFGVIIIHIAGNTLNTFKLSGVPSIVYTMIYRLLYFALPLFVMISGTLLLNKDIDYKDIFKKYIKKMVLILLMFGGVYAFLEEYSINNTVELSSFTNILKRLITGDLWAHMWYIYLLISLYLITPILRNWVKQTSEKEQLFCLGVLYIFTILLNEISSIFNIEIAFTVPITTGFVFSYLLGNYLYNNELSSKVKSSFYFLGVVSVLAIILLTYFEMFEYLIQYTSTLCMIIAINVYIIFKDKEFSNKKVCNVICILGKCSLGIYLIHQLFINIIYKVIKFDLILKIPYLGIILYFLIIFIPSFVTIYLLKKIKIIDKYLL